MQTKTLLFVSLSTIVALFFGYAIGHHFATRTSSGVFTQNADSPTVAESTMSIEAAQLQREEHYQNLNSISEILSLPSLFAQNEALHAVAGRANKLLLLKLLKETAGVRNTQKRTTLMQVLVLRLTEIDPRSASKIALEAYQNRNYSLLSVVYQNWAKLDTEASVLSANKIKDKYQHETAAQGIIAAIDADNIALILELSERLGLVSNHLQYQSIALIEKAAQDPESAMQEAMFMPKGYEREDAMIGAMDAWTVQDPEQAFAFTQKVNDKIMRQRLQETVLYRWAETDPQSAYEIMMTLPKSNITNVSYTVFSNLANQNPAEALEMIENIPSSRNRSDAYSATITSWAAKDAQAAADFVAQLGNKQLQQQLSSTIVQYLSEQSPEDALAWAKEMDPTGQQYLQDTVVGQIAAKDPERAFQIAEAAQQTNLRQQLRLTVINSLSYSDPARGAELIDQLPITDVDSELVNAVMYGWANSDPEAAMTWVNAKSGQIREDGLISLGSQLASSDPDLAASYLPQLNGAVRESWAQNITYYYSSYDVSEAANWIERFRGENFYSELVRAVASTAVSTDVDYALQLAQNMPTKQEHNDLLRQLADQIAYNNPQRAQQLYNRLPAEEQPES